MNDNEFNAIKLEIEKDLLFRYSKEDVYKMLLKALDLINSQKAEIERLRKFLDMSRKVSLARRDENIRKDELMIKMSAECKTAKAEAKKEFASELIEEIVNTPTKFESSYYMYRQGIAFRQNEIIDIIQRKVGDV